MGRRNHNVSPAHRLANWLILLLPLLLVAGLCLWSWNHHRHLPDKIFVYTAHAGGSSITTGDTLKRLFEEETESKVDVFETEGSVQDVDELQQVGWFDRDGHLAIVQQEAIPTDGSVRPIAPLFREFVFFVVTPDSKVKDFADVVPPIALGDPKSGMLLTSSKVVRALDWKKIDVTEAGNQVHADVLLKDKGYNGAIVTTGPTSETIRQLLRAKCRLVPLTDSQRSALAGWPTDSVSFPVPADETQTDPSQLNAMRSYTTITTTTYLVGRKNCQNALVAKTLKLLYNHRQSFTNPPILPRRQANLQRDRSRISHHNEAKRFYQSAK